MRVRAPLEQPLSYPGAWPTAAFRLRGDRVEPLTEPERATTQGSGRRAVLAIGSNACPEQLSVKFRGRGCSDVVVGLIVDVDALVVRPSAHVSRSGYWPFAPARLDGGGTRCVLTLLDDGQVEVLDRTEPNYDRIVLDRAVHRVSVAQQTFDADVEVYASRHGVVDDDRLPAFPDVATTDALPGQHALIAALLRLTDGDPDGDLPSTPELLSDAVRRQPDVAERVTGAIRSLHVRPAGLATARAARAARAVLQDDRRCGRLPMPSPSER